MNSTKTLRIGAVGHRPDLLSRESQAALRAKFALLFQTIRSCASGTEHFVLVSALAEGADRIAAQAGLAAGFSLDVILPFPAAVYEADFTASGSLAEFGALLARAGTCRTLPGGKSSDDPNVAISAYAAAASAVLETSDLLIAVWDGLPPRSEAGTGATVQRALAQGLPVLRFDEAAGGPCCWSGHAPVSRTAEAVPDDILRNWLIRHLA